jgi:SulP family sulfate permease
VLYVWSSASDVKVRALIPTDDGRFAEGDPPESLPSRQVTVLDVYGSLFFAGARTLADALPDPERSTRPAVVLRLRGRTQFGSTLIDVLDGYADALADVGGRLYLTGLSPAAARQLRRSAKLDLDETVQVIEADPVLGASTGQAIASARAWLEGLPS